jgi:hypothetical protein
MRTQPPRSAPPGSWKTYDGARRAAALLLGSWRMTFDMCLELAQFADIREAAAAEVPEALKDLAERTERTLEIISAVQRTARRGAGARLASDSPSVGGTTRRSWRGSAIQVGA